MRENKSVIQSPEKGQGESQKNKNADESTFGQPAPKSKSPSALGRFFHFMYNRDTRLGRFNRLALRWFAIVVSLFAVGLLTGYVVLYRPAQNELKNLKAQSELDQQKISGLTNKVQDLTQQNSTLTGQKQELTTSLSAANDQLQLLQMVGQLQTARLYIEKKDYSAARKALLESRTALPKLTSIIEKQDSTLPKTMQTRLDLVLGELDSSPQTAASDTEILITLLLDAENKLAGTP
jgi:hypothetical protein